MINKTFNYDFLKVAQFKICLEVWQKNFWEIRIFYGNSWILFPFAVALCEQSESLAAQEKKPVAVLAGHGFYVVMVIISGFIALVLGVSGYLIGGISLTLASLLSAYIIRIFLNWTHDKHLPVGHTMTAVAQVR